jgi:hypothetical protein
MAALLKAKGAGTTVKKKIPITKRSDVEVKSMLNYLKMIQPTIQAGSKKYSGVKVSQYLAKQYKSKKTKENITSAEKFLDKVATKTTTGQTFYVIERDGSKTLLKTWLKDYLRKLRVKR